MNTMNSKIRALQESISDKVQSDLKTLTPTYVAEKIANKLTVSTMDFSLPFGYSYKGLVEFSGQRVVNSADFGLVQGRCKIWEKSVGVNVVDLQDDNLGLYKSYIDDLPKAALSHYDQLVASALSTNGVCAGGDALFSTSQTWKGLNATAQSNSLSLALSKDNVATAMQTMRLFKDPYGSLVGAKPSILLVPASLEMLANEIIAPLNASAGYNVLANKLEVVVLDELADQSAWYLIDGRVKPINICTKQQPEVKMIDKSVEEFKIIYTVDCMDTTANGLWVGAIKSKP